MGPLSIARICTETSSSSIRSTPCDKDKPSLGELPLLAVAAQSRVKLNHPPHRPRRTAAARLMTPDLTDMTVEFRVGDLTAGRVFAVVG